MHLKLKIIPQIMEIECGFMGIYANYVYEKRCLDQ